MRRIQNNQRRLNTAAGMRGVEITAFQKQQGDLTKTIWINTKTGNVKSDGAACRMAKGTARRYKIQSAGSLARLLELTPMNVAYALGSLRDGVPDRAGVVLARDLKNERTGVIARSKDYLCYSSGKPALMLLDHDAKAMPVEVEQEVKRLGGFWPALVSVIPDLAHAARVLRRSTSAGLYDGRTKERLAGSGGWHVYIEAASGADIERALKTLHERLWLNGLGYYIVGAIGQLLDRSIIDAAVYGPERLCFEAKAKTKWPVKQDAEARKCITHEGDSIDTKTAILDLSAGEKATIADLKAAARERLEPEATAARKLWAKKFAARHGLSEEEAERIAMQAVNHILEPEFEIEFDDPELGICTVGDVLDDPDTYVGETLADPLEGVAYGRDKAKVYRQKDGRLMINSFAHGGIKYQLVEAGEESEAGGSNGERETQAGILLALVPEDSLFRTKDQASFADINVNGHRETWAIKSTKFQRWLIHQYFLKTKATPGGEAVRQAVEMVEAKAAFGEHVPVREVFIRVGGHDGAIYLDLCDEDWQVVKITADGWSIVNNPAVRFRRKPGMLPLPEPEPGGSIGDLRPFVNVRGAGAEKQITDTDFVLLVAWLLAALRESGPYPILKVYGEHGATKSTLTKLLRALTDPHKSEARQLPRENRDLFVAANNAWVQSYDNVSSIPEWMSNALCVIATGGGFATRTLYTDEDEQLFEAMRPTILNGIENFVTKHDLADRIILAELPFVPRAQRRREKEFWADFEAKRPGILGALLDVVVHGLKTLPDVVEEDWPRMADFAHWITACEGALWDAGTFRKAYEINRRKANLSAIDDDPVAAALRDLMSFEPYYWHGTTEELLDRLVSRVGETASRSRDWPLTPRALTGRLQTAQGALRRVGITIKRERTKYARLVTITNTNHEADALLRSANDRHHRHHRHLFSDSNDLRGDDLGDGGDGVRSSRDPRNNLR
jgi:hypothetical protein